MPDIRDLGAYDDKTFPLPVNFYDKYENRPAAKDQEMEIDKFMRLKEDLKVHLDYDDKSGYSAYTHFTEEQRKQFSAYYDKITREFDEHHYTGDALLRWKFQRYMKDYLATARSLDRNIGRLLAYIDKNNLKKNTIVIYASDQGFYMGEHGWFDKRFMYEESVKTPMVMRYPGTIQPGTVINDMVVNIDFAPTLLDAAGVKVPDDMQGKSFLRGLFEKIDKTGHDVDQIFTEVGRLVNDTTQEPVSDEKWILGVHELRSVMKSMLLNVVASTNVIY